MIPSVFTLLSVNYVFKYVFLFMLPMIIILSSYNDSMNSMIKFSTGSYVKTSI